MISPTESSLHLHLCMISPTESSLPFLSRHSSLSWFSCIMQGGMDSKATNSHTSSVTSSVTVSTVTSPILAFRSSPIFINVGSSMETISNVKHSCSSIAFSNTINLLSRTLHVILSESIDGGGAQQESQGGEAGRTSFGKIAVKVTMMSSLILM